MKETYLWQKRHVYDKRDMSITKDIEQTWIYMTRACERETFLWARDILVRETHSYTWLETLKRFSYISHEIFKRHCFTWQERFIRETHSCERDTFMRETHWYIHLSRPIYHALQHTALQHTTLQHTTLQHTALQHTALQHIPRMYHRLNICTHIHAEAIAPCDIELCNVIHRRLHIRGGRILCAICIGA